MLPGLLTTTMVTVLMCASVFQRRSRVGFLDELETVRGEALTAPHGEVATAVAMADAEMAQDRLERGDGAHEPDWHGWPGEETTVDQGEDIWAQPSPHPIRPQEMWHPGRPAARFDAPAGLGDRAVSHGGPTESATTTEHDDGTEVPDDVGHVGGWDVAASDAPSVEDGRRRRFSRFRPAALSGATDAVTSSPEVPVIPTSGANGLLGGPVARRGRPGRERRPLPTADPLRAQSTKHDDRSPLNEAPLPPASPPAATPATVSKPVAEQPPEPVDRVDPPAAAAPDPDDLHVPEPVLDDRSELAVGATVVRFGEGSRTSMDHGDLGPVLQLEEGWCWVTTQGEGPLAQVRVQLPNGDLAVVAGGRALAVVEHDGSAFVVIVDGSAELLRAETTLELASGSMVLLPVTGDPQVDRAEADELTLDPLVGHNLTLDADR